MSLLFDTKLALNYKNTSQKIRVMSEAWVKSNLYCPRCGRIKIKKEKNNMPVADFFCDNCGEIFELKSKKNRIGHKITDGAYDTAIERITSNSNPDLLVMLYNTTNMSISELWITPKQFFVPDIIEKRKPLSVKARRAGWTGCNILYSQIPEQGKICIIKDGEWEDKDSVIYTYNNRLKFITRDMEARGWLLDILNCVNSIHKKYFSLSDMYKFTGALKLKHPNNNNIEAKIRQQLQILRDKGFIIFQGNGKYIKVD